MLQVCHTFYTSHMHARTQVPFRLTRMMIRAMEVSGIEGNFRTTCENVMRVLRANKESVTAMLEAFVHDPLINWRLLNAAEAATEAALGRGPAESVSGMEGGVVGGTGAGLDALGGGAGGGDGANMPSPPRRDARERELRQAIDQMGRCGLRLCVLGMALGCCVLPSAVHYRGAVLGHFPCMVVASHCTLRQLCFAAAC